MKPTEEDNFINAAGSEPKQDSPAEIQTGANANGANSSPEKISREMIDEILAAGENAENGADGNETGGISRRDFLKTSSVAATAALIASQLLPKDRVWAFEQLTRPAEAPAVDESGFIEIALDINGRMHKLKLDARTSLLDALREHLNLTGTKKGCDRGQCGSCTILMDGKRINSCLKFAALCQNQKIVTIEGIADADSGELHPLQTAFIKHDALQCGFCTPGQICSGVAMLNEIKAGVATCLDANLTDLSPRINASDADLRERLSGNICRCAAYPGILAAVREVMTAKV